MHCYTNVLNPGGIVSGESPDVGDDVVDRFNRRLLSVTDIHNLEEVSQNCHGHHASYPF